MRWLKHLFAPQNPFPVDKFPGYYGWVIVTMGTFAMAAALPASPPGIAPFADHMMESMNLSREAFSGAYMIGTILAGLAIPLTGAWFDRYNNRMLVVAGQIFLALTLVVLGWGDRILLHFMGEGPMTEKATIIVLIGCFFLLRYLSIGVVGTGTRTMIFRWFRKNRGKAASINGVMLSLSFSSAPVLFNFVVNGFGWRGAWGALALFFGLILALLCWLLLRDSPKSVGVPIEAESDNLGKDGRPIVIHDFTLAQAARKLTFWIAVLGIAYSAFFSTGIAFNIVALAAERGLDRDTALMLFLPAAVFNIATTLILGARVERIPLAWVLALMIGAQALSLVGATVLETMTGKVLYMLGSGIGWGSFGIIANVVWPRYFGQKHLGAINGAVSGMVIITTALGPFLFSIVFTATDSFGPVMLAGAVLALIMLPFSFFLRTPSPPAPPPANP